MATTPRNKPAVDAAALAALGNNLGDDPVANTEGLEPAPAVQAAPPRVRIILEDSPDIPPTGQFLSANGVGYVLRPGEEVDVPMSLIHVLDDAVMSTPIVDNNGTVIGSRDRLRFPYRVITKTRRADGVRSGE